MRTCKSSSGRYISKVGNMIYFCLINDSAFQLLLHLRENIILLLCFAQGKHARVSSVSPNTRAESRICWCFFFPSERSSTNLLCSSFSLFQPPPQRSCCLCRSCSHLLPLLRSLASSSSSIYLQESTFLQSVRNAVSGAHAMCHMNQCFCC